METQLRADLRNICVTRVLRRIPLVKQELATLPEHLGSPAIFSLVRVTRSLILCAMLCRSLFVLLSLFLWPICCLSFEWLILITHLVSSNSSYLVLSLITRYKAKLSEPMHLLFDILFYSRLKLCSIITFYSGSERVIQCLYNDVYVVKMTYLFRWVLDQLTTSEFTFSIFKHSLIARPK